MNRRDSLALGLLGLTGLAGCRRQEFGEVKKIEEHLPVMKRDREGESLVPVEVDPSLEIRTTVGLRPFRSPGFVVRRDVLGEKTLIHNYGHGGGGMTLSWGTSELAVRLAEVRNGQACAVIGGGVMGLSVARLLQLRGAQVTLYTTDLPPETTSNRSGAQWWPFSVFDDSRRTPEFAAQFIEASKFSYQYFQGLVGPKWGVHWVPNYYLSDDEPHNGWIGGPQGVLRDLQVGLKDFGPGEHVFPSRYVRRFHTMMIEPATYLRELLNEVQEAGAQIRIQTFTQLDELAQLPESLIFNCCGLGAGPLLGDVELMPIRGQLTLLLPQPQVNYNLISGTLYMFARADGIVLGGTYDKHRSDLGQDAAAKAQILARHQRLFDRMRENLSA